MQYFISSATASDGGVFCNTGCSSCGPAAAGAGQPGQRRALHPDSLSAAPHSGCAPGAAWRAGSTAEPAPATGHVCCPGHGFWHGWADVSTGIQPAGKTSLNHPSELALLGSTFVFPMHWRHKSDVGATGSSSIYMLHSCHTGNDRRIYVDKKLSSALWVQMPPPPPPGQQQRPGGVPGQGGQQPGAFSGRLPPLQQPGGAFPAPQPRPVASDWARAYREQQNKAAQVSSPARTWPALALPQGDTTRLQQCLL